MSVLLYKLLVTFIVMDMSTLWSKIEDIFVQTQQCPSGAVGTVPFDDLLIMLLTTFVLLTVIKSSGTSLIIRLLNRYRRQISVVCIGILLLWYAILGIIYNYFGDYLLMTFIAVSTLLCRIFRFIVNVLLRGFRTIRFAFTRARPAMRPMNSCKVISSRRQANKQAVIIASKSQNELDKIVPFVSISCSDIRGKTRIPLASSKIALAKLTTSETRLISKCGYKTSAKPSASKSFDNSKPIKPFLTQSCPDVKKVLHAQSEWEVVPEYRIQDEIPIGFIQKIFHSGSTLIVYPPTGHVTNVHSSPNITRSVPDSVTSLHHTRSLPIYLRNNDILINNLFPMVNIVPQVESSTEVMNNEFLQSTSESFVVLTRTTRSRVIPVHLFSGISMLNTNRRSLPVIITKIELRNTISAPVVYPGIVQSELSIETSERHLSSSIGSDIISKAYQRQDGCLVSCDKRGVWPSRTSGTGSGVSDYELVDDEGTLFTWVFLEDEIIQDIIFRPPDRWTRFKNGTKQFFRYWILGEYNQIAHYRG